MKLSKALLASTVVLALGLWYAYWWSAGEAPTPAETMLLVGIAGGLAAGATALAGRVRSARTGKSQ